PRSRSFCCIKASGVSNKINIGTRGSTTLKLRVILMRGAMLIFSVLFQVFRMSPRRGHEDLRRWGGHDGQFCVVYDLRSQGAAIYGKMTPVALHSWDSWALI
ncbi:hypothetical protein BDZ89DRAFT_316788, partial [Hymenopellis radicata]